MPIGAMRYGYDEDEDFADETTPKGNLIAAIMAALSRNPPNPKPPPPPREPLDIGLREDVGVRGKFVQDVPSPEELRRIWLGTETEPPTGTHIKPGPPNVRDQTLTPKARLAWKQIQQEHPYAAANANALSGYSPSDPNELGVTDPFGTLVNNNIDDDELLYNTLLHELVHSGQWNNQFDEKWLRRSRSAAEIPAYGAEDFGTPMPEGMQKWLAQARKK